MRIKAIWTTASLLILLSACRWSTDPEGGTYTATITGAVDTTLTGRAALERGVGLDEFEYAVHMFLPGHGPEFGIFLFFPERPVQGTYVVANKSAAFLEPGEVSAGALIGVGFVATSGEVRITSSNPLRGDFYLVEQWGADETRIRGEFTLQ